jgi:hypothetical protein
LGFGVLEEQAVDGVTRLKHENQGTILARNGERLIPLDILERAFSIGKGPSSSKNTLRLANASSAGSG